MSQTKIRLYQVYALIALIALSMLVVSAVRPLKTASLAAPSLFGAEVSASTLSQMDHPQISHAGI